MNFEDQALLRFTDTLEPRRFRLAISDKKGRLDDGAEFENISDVFSLCQERNPHFWCQVDVNEIALDEHENVVCKIQCSYIFSHWREPKRFEIYLLSDPDIKEIAWILAKLRIGTCFVLQRGMLANGVFHQYTLTIF